MVSIMGASQSVVAAAVAVAVGAGSAGANQLKASSGLGSLLSNAYRHIPTTIMGLQIARSRYHH